MIHWKELVQPSLYWGYAQLRDTWTCCCRVLYALYTSDRTCVGRGDYVGPGRAPDMQHTSDHPHIPRDATVVEVALPFRRCHVTPIFFVYDHHRALLKLFCAQPPWIECATVATTFYKRLVSFLSDKWDENYSHTMGWLRCRLIFALLLASIMCIRGAQALLWTDRFWTVPSIAGRMCWCPRADPVGWIGWLATPQVSKKNLIMILSSSTYFISLMLACLPCMN